MKTSNRNSHQSGSALLVTLATAGVIGITLASYLSMTSSQNTAVTRSQLWNSAIPICEAGVEESLTQLYYNYTNLSANSWSSNANAYHKSRTLPEGRFHAMISNSSPPVIYVIGHVMKPFSTNELARRIRVDTMSAAMFAKGMVAKGDITWVGNITSDSFDSQDPTYSTGGRYDTTKRKDNGSVGSNNGSISMGSGIIYGAAATGPSGAANNGTVGDFAWASNHTGIEAGHYDNNMNLSFPDVLAPFNSGYFTAFDTGGLVTSTNYTVTATVVTNATYPAPSTFSGLVVTITATVTNLAMPNPLPGGTITTNSSRPVVSSSPPSPAPAGGVVVTNTVVSASSTVPDPLPNGGIGTNTVHYTDVGKNSVPGNAVNITVSASNAQKRDYDITTYYSTNLSYSYTSVTYSYATAAYIYTVNHTNATLVYTEYDYFLLSGNYKIDSWPSGNPKIYVAGGVVLYVPNGFRMSGQGGITIGPSGSLKIYAGGDVALDGNGVFNSTGDALRFSLFGLPTCSEIKLSGNASFTGTIYAPEAKLVSGGGGSDNYDIVGACIVGEVKMNGHFTFHYDENLGRNGPSKGFVITAWNEY